MMERICAACLRRYRGGYGETLCSECRPRTETKTTPKAEKPDAIIPAGGTKFDEDKPRIDLFPPEAILGISKILGFGAAKYGDRNWEKGMDWSRIYGAAQRHALAWWGGEDKDPETGMSHLWHWGCNTTFLIAYEQWGVGNDNRPSTLASNAADDIFKGLIGGSR